jgi:hypothetical protein
MEANNKNNKMETATEKLARMKKEMEELEKAVAEEQKQKAVKERQAKAVAFSEEKRSKPETKALLVKLYLLENPLKAEKQTREKKPAKIKYGRCIGRAWGEGYGCQCGKNAIGENGFCTKHNKEMELPGNCIALGLWEEERPTHFKGGKMQKNEKIGSEIKWKNREKAKTEETEEKPEEEEEVVEELGAEA